MVDSRRPDGDKSGTGPLLGGAVELAGGMSASWGCGLFRPASDWSSAVSNILLSVAGFSAESSLLSCLPSSAASEILSVSADGAFFPQPKNS